MWPSTLPKSSELYVGRRFITVTGRSAFCILASVFISTVLFTVRIPIANQRCADALTWAQDKPPHKNKRGKKENIAWDQKVSAWAPNIVLILWCEFKINPHCPRKECRLFWSSFCNMQNWFWPCMNNNIENRTQILIPGSYPQPSSTLVCILQNHTRSTIGKTDCFLLFNLTSFESRSPLFWNHWRRCQSPAFLGILNIHALRAWGLD